MAPGSLPASQAAQHNSLAHSWPLLQMRAGMLLYPPKLDSWGNHEQTGTDAAQWGPTWARLATPSLVFWSGSREAPGGGRSSSSSSSYFKERMGPGPLGHSLEPIHPSKSSGAMACFRDAGACLHCSEGCGWAGPSVAAPGRRPAGHRSSYASSHISQGRTAAPHGHTLMLSLSPMSTAGTSGGMSRSASGTLQGGGQD